MINISSKNENNGLITCTFREIDGLMMERMKVANQKLFEKWKIEN